MPEVKKELTMLACSLIKRMRIDLTGGAEEDIPVLDDDQMFQRGTTSTPRCWLAHPRTLRLTTRPRPPQNLDGSRPRMFNRKSRSCNMPSVIFSFNRTIEALAEIIVNDSLLPLFRQLHSEKPGWDLNLMNLCVTNMDRTGTDSKDGIGRDIGRMFRRQEGVLKGWKIEDEGIAPLIRSEVARSDFSEDFEPHNQSKALDEISWNEREDVYKGTQDSTAADNAWNSEIETANLSEACVVCGTLIPFFAIAAHQRFHSLPD